MECVLWKIIIFCVCILIAAIQSFWLTILTGMTEKLLIQYYSLVNAVVFWCLKVPSILKSLFCMEPSWEMPRVYLKAPEYLRNNRWKYSTGTVLPLFSRKSTMFFFCNLVTYINLSGFNLHKFCIKFFFQNRYFYSYSLLDMHLK